MKLKRLPEDFQVEELSAFAPEGGEFALYTLTKRSMGTPEVVDALCRRWRIQRHRVAWGGLKDRHSLTKQFLTIRHGPRRDLRQKSFELRYRGQADRPFAQADIAANRFRVVMRDMSRAAAEAACAALDEAARDGVPNYYDDQRFGSLGESGEFVAAAWCAGNWERALWLALADPNDHDRPRDRRRKETLREHWGRWDAAAPALEPGLGRDAAAYLADRAGDFRGAFARLPDVIRGLYLSAFQGHLWNHALARLLRGTCRPEQLVTVSLRSAAVVFPRGLDEAQRIALAAAIVPLPSARARVEGAMKVLLDETLADLGLDLDALRIRHPGDSFFSRGFRPAMFTPRELVRDVDEDDLYAGRRKLTMRFDLPRGCYATMLVKRLTTGSDGATKRRRSDEAKERPSVGGRE